MNHLEIDPNISSIYEHIYNTPVNKQEIITDDIIEPPSLKRRKLTVNTNSSSSEESEKEITPVFNKKNLPFRDETSPLPKPYKSTDFQYEDINISEDESIDECVYVIKIDGNIDSYAYSEDDAKIRMWDLVNIYMGDGLDRYSTHLHEVSDNECHILKRHLFFVISYDFVEHRISYEKVHPC